QDVQNVGDEEEDNRRPVPVDDRDRPGQEAQCYPKDTDDGHWIPLNRLRDGGLSVWTRPVPNPPLRSVAQGRAPSARRRPRRQLRWRRSATDSRPGCEVEPRR